MIFELQRVCEAQCLSHAWSCCEQFQHKQQHRQAGPRLEVCITVVIRDVVSKGVEPPAPQQLAVHDCQCKEQAPGVCACPAGL